MKSSGRGSRRNTAIRFLTWKDMAEPTYVPLLKIDSLRSTMPKLVLVSLLLPSAASLHAAVRSPTRWIATRCRCSPACSALPTDALRLDLAAAAAEQDRPRLASLIDELERLRETEDRCATSVLLDGFWETVYASESPAWARGGRLRHAIEYSLPVAPPLPREPTDPPPDATHPPTERGSGDVGWTTQAATQVTGSALSGPGLLQRPDGSLWADVRRGHGAYVQRSKHRFGTDEASLLYFEMFSQMSHVRVDQD